MLLLVDSSRTVSSVWRCTLTVSGFLKSKPHFCLTPKSNWSWFEFQFQSGGKFVNHVTKTRWWSNNGLMMPAYGCESWTIKKAEHQRNWCFWTVVLEKTLESHLDCKEIQPVHPKGDQSWLFIGRTDAEAETPILWLPDSKSWLIGKDPDAGKDWRQEDKGTTEDEMIGWHHWLDGQKFE